MLAWPSALLAIGYGAFLAQREARKPPRQLVWPEAGPVTLDGDEINGITVHWRGSLAFLCWRMDGRIHRLSWWPDTLAAGARRELRLAVMRRSPVPPSRSMAT